MKPVVQESDLLPGRPILLTIAVSFATAVLITVLAVVLLHAFQGTTRLAGPAPIPPADALTPGVSPAEVEPAPPSVGIVQQTLIRREVAPADQADRDHEWLQTWGWVDPRARTVHMPIETAMVLVQERP